MRPPRGDSRAATVIARVLPAFRRRGVGAAIYEVALAHAESQDARLLETVVLATNVDGLRFALRRGFAVTERYVLPGEAEERITLSRSALP